MPLLSAPFRATPTPQEYLTSKGFEARDLPSCKKYLKMVGEHELRRPVPVFTAATAILGDLKNAKISHFDRYNAIEQLTIAALVGPTNHARRVIHHRVPCQPACSAEIIITREQSVRRAER